MYIYIAGGERFPSACLAAARRIIELHLIIITSLLSVRESARARARSQPANRDCKSLISALYESVTHRCSARARVRQAALRSARHACARPLTRMSAPADASAKIAGAGTIGRNADIVFRIRDSMMSFSGSIGRVISLLGFEQKYSYGSKIENIVQVQLVSRIYFSHTKYFSLKTFFCGTETLQISLIFFS